MKRSNSFGLYAGLALLVGAVALIIIAPWQTDHSTNPQTGLETVKIAQWGQERYLIYLPMYVAIEKGYFKDAGLDVTLTFTGNDDQTFAAVISGDAQFGVGDPVFTAISQERHFPGKVVATIVDGVAIWGVTNKPGISEISKPEQFAGLRIGTFPEPSTNYTLMKELLQKNKDVLKGATIVQAPIGSQLALLEGDKADIAMELEPATSIAVSKGYRVVYSSPRFHGRFAFTGLTTTQKLTTEKPELVQKVVSAFEKAVVTCHNDPAAAIEVAKKLFPTLPDGVPEAAVRRMLSEKTLPDHVEVDEEAWQKALATRLVVGDLKKPQETSVAVDNRFAVAARQSNK